MKSRGRNRRINSESGDRVIPSHRVNPPTKVQRGFGFSAFLLGFKRNPISASYGSIVADFKTDRAIRSIVRRDVR